MSRRPVRPAIPAATAVALLLLLPRPAMSQGPGGGAPPPAPVTYVEVTPCTVPVAYEAIGTTEPSRRVEIRARVEGYLQKRHFVEGGRIVEGDLLFELDRAQYEADLQVARAHLDEAKARQLLAERELQRLEDLQQSGSFTQGERDKRIAERDAALASVRLAEANVAKADLELSYTMIRSPLTGLVGLTERDEGSFIEKGAEGLLTDVWQIDPIYATFRLSERKFLEWKQDLASGAIRLPDGGKPHVQLLLLDGSPYPHVGLLNFEGIRIEPMTGTIEMRGEFPNPDGVLMAGQYVRGRVAGWERLNVIAIPQRAVIQSATGASVYVLGDDDTVQPRPVVLGDWIHDRWVVKEGLQPGDRVIVDGIVKLGPGARVAPTLLPPPEQPAASATATASAPPLAAAPATKS